MGGGQGGGAPGVFVLNRNTQREVGRKAQLTNIQAGKTVAGIVRTTLGPRAMLKMLLDPMGGIVMTSDGTTSVIILAGEMLSVAEPLLLKKLHPTQIVSGYMRALDDALELLKSMAVPIDLDKPAAVSEIVGAAIGTKFVSRWGSLISDLAIKATQTVCIVN